MNGNNGKLEIKRLVVDWSNNSHRRIVLHRNKR